MKRRQSILRELGSDLFRLHRASAGRADLARQLALARLRNRALLETRPAGVPARLARLASGALSLAGAELRTLLETAAVWLLAGVGYAAVALGLVWVALYALSRWP
jgi:hypothetical protein